MVLMKGVRKIMLGVIIQVLFWCTSVTVEAKRTKGLDLMMISEQSSISAGSKFILGVRIKHEKGFHSYWRNPGIVGMATDIKWKLPEGFTAESIQWPYPELSSMAGHPCHGYERDVTLMVQIQAPEKLSLKQVKLTASLSWMCCADDCFPGFKDLTITLPVSEKSVVDTKNAAVFNEARKQLPINDCPWDVVMLSKQDAAVIQFRLTMKASLKGKGGITPEYIFSDDGQISSDEEQRFIMQKDGSFLFTINRSEFSPKFKKELSGVLKVGDLYYSIRGSYKDFTKVDE